jgi:hypothetical protein
MCSNTLDLVQILYDQTEPTAADYDAGQQVSDQHGKPESFADDPGHQSRAQDDQEILGEFNRDRRTTLSEVLSFGAVSWIT